ncbi:MAG: alanine--tRNA ligase [Candidatus Bathyarchaeota archaeon]|nr:alanine--tRNA ligase [Candidatus Bathyarchaeota archaeon]
MNSSDIRRKYLEFFIARGHTVVPAAPIVPVNDPTTLFTSSGMQQMAPYLKGQPHPMGKRLVDSQPSFRAEDIEEVGDNRHTCMFEMLGNWSLGDYFKKDQLHWVYEFLTQEICLNPAKLYVSVFAGDDSVGRDDESIKLWQEIFDVNTPAKLGVEGFDAATKIYLYPASKNWWSRAGVPANMPVGEVGGPDSEVFYDFGAERQMHENSLWKTQMCHVNCECGRFLEIGNSVFMQFLKTDKGMEPLPAKNVDFGGGLERLAAVCQDTPDIFTTDMFSQLIQTIELSSGRKYGGEYMPPIRVIADHLRAAVFMIAQGTIPDNKLQGYVLRRLLRRAAVHGRLLGGDIQAIFAASIPTVVKFYADAGFIQSDVESNVLAVVTEELQRFSKVLERGIKIIENRSGQLDEQVAFDLYQSYGFPFEITRELVAERGIQLDQTKFNLLFTQHKEGSRTASAGMFKGGLADQSELTTKYHTATHLLHQALRDVLGNDIQQAGSNITSKRLRFDYTYPSKPTAEQLRQVNEIINAKILADLPVHKNIQNKNDALKSGARAFFAEKYPDKVSVYTIGKDQEKDWYSKELCGGNHVTHTGEIGPIQIEKDEALGTDHRRIYAKIIEHSEKIT